MVAASPGVTRPFTVPIFVTVQADHPEIALREVDGILTQIAETDRHLEVSAKIPHRDDAVPSLTFPSDA
jgi:hypothetical protein